MTGTPGLRARAAELVPERGVLTRVARTISTSDRSAEGSAGAERSGNSRGGRSRKELRLSLVLGLALLAGAAALAFGQARAPEAATVVTFPSVSLENFGSLSFGAPSDPQLEREVIRGAAREIGVRPETIRSSVSLSSDREANTVTISAEAASPEAAREIADAVSFHFVTFYRKLLFGQLTRAKEFVEFLLEETEEADGDAAEIASLRSDRGRLQLALFGIDRGTSPQVVESAQVRASSPFSGTAIRGAAIAAVGGLLLGLGVMRLLERSDRPRESGEQAA